ncbi:rRNA maturation RNase YbeY [uncultured Thiodictyon sp.]|uniref:rRNA maturation RNase YbeY n=1 Tax=uncultured Thiodictyon sp. TaxID=1846217 RepID=UPI0025FFFB0E|nr:rRNA maturation RNase YbeY [uncultured Thiodictyon sp.]
MELDLDLQVATAAPDLPTQPDFERWAVAALEGRRERATLTIRIVDVTEGQALNLYYRGQEHPTNVLSFPFEAPPGLPGEEADDLLGDLVICAAVVSREAQEQGKPAPAHWAHLVVHGVLHLLGEDHLNDPEAEQMEGLETDILGRLGFPPPYAETPVTP